MCARTAKPACLKRCVDRACARRPATSRAWWLLLLWSACMPPDGQAVQPEETNRTTAEADAPDAATSKGLQVTSGAVPGASLPAGLQEMLLPHWGSSTLWDVSFESAMYYVQQDGVRSTQYHTTALEPEPEGSALWNWRYRIGLAPDSAFFELFALRAKLPQPWHWTAAPPMPADARPGQAADRPTDPQPDKAVDAGSTASGAPVAHVPALGLPFWLRQCALQPGAGGRFAVQAQAGSMLPPAPGTGKNGVRVLEWHVAALDSLAFGEHRWGAWKLEARSPVSGPADRKPASGAAVLTCWVDRRYPHTLLRWEGTQGQTGQLAARHWMDVR